MTRSDVTNLQGDPTATMTPSEWAYDLAGQLARMPDRTQRQTWNEMTDDERDMVREFAADGVREFHARLDWIAASHADAMKEVA